VDNWEFWIGDYVSQESRERNDIEQASFKVEDELMQQQVITNSESEREYISGLVSVVIPTYNQVNFVKETFDSVLAQDYPNLQIIITDDGSTDGTVEIIQAYAGQYPNKVIAVLSENNTGIPANLNRGLRKVKGEYIAWLGGDDLMLPRKISMQVELLQRRQDAVGCCHDAEVFQSQDGRVIGLFSELNNGKRALREGGVELWFAQNYFMLPSTMMIRADAAPGHGFDERLRYLNDWLFDVEVFRKGKCVPINQVLCKYRRHENNVTGSSDARSIACEETAVALSIIENRYPELYPLIKKQRVLTYLGSAIRALIDKDLQGVRNHLKIAIRNGAMVRGTLVFIAITLYGKYIVKQLLLPQYQRSKIFVKLSRFLKSL